jgi:hypothetical protein
LQEHARFWSRSIGQGGWITDVIEGKRPKVPFGHTESLRKAKSEADTEQGELPI